MCYSAMVHKEYERYVRMTGASMDYHQFVETFGDRVKNPKLSIPRAVERWFDEPKTDDERAVRELIEVHRTAQASKWQQELFKQKKRLGDAERQLAVKETKTATESKRIASEKVESLVKKLNILDDPKARASDGRIFPMNYAPIVINDSGRRVIRLARYHCRLAGEPASIDGRFPSLYNARREHRPLLARGIRDHARTHAGGVVLRERGSRREERGASLYAASCGHHADRMLILGLGGPKRRQEAALVRRDHR